MQDKIEVLNKRPEVSLLNLSVSKAKTFKECQAKFKFIYIDRLPRKERDYHIFGKFLHAILEHFHKEILNNNLEPNNIIISKSFKFAHDIYKEKLNQDQIKEAKEIINKYLKKLEVDKLSQNSSKILAVEEEFFININDRILLNGFIDRVQIDPDGMFHVGDYKTTLLLDKKDLSIPFNKTDKYKRYKKDLFQLKTYAFVQLLKNPNLNKVRCSFVMLRHDFHLIEQVFEREEILKMKDVFIDYANKIEEEKLFRHVITPLCSYCEFAEKDICGPGYNYVQEQEAKRNLGKNFGESDW